MSSRVGQRVEVDGFRATILFEGEVPPSEGVWFGVEWDDPSRGKHDGSNNGIKYFSCRHATGGSFVRPKKVDFGLSFLEALEHQYTTKPDNRPEENFTVLDSRNVQVAVEVFGNAKLEQRLNQLDQLELVDLKGQKVSESGPFDDISRICPGIRSLDVSATLIASIEWASNVAPALPQLSVLRMSNNRMTRWPQPITLVGKFETLTALFLNEIGTDWKTIEQYGLCFPNLQDLHLCENGIQTLGQSPGMQLAFPKLRLLNLDNNLLTDWQSTCDSLARFPGLQVLILARNKFQRIYPTTALQNVQELNLNTNLISEWDSVSLLRCLTSLRELRIRDNPFATSDRDLNIRQIIIAHLPRSFKIQHLNGSPVTEKERMLAERFYLTMYFLKWTESEGKEQVRAEFLASHAHFPHLLAVHGPPDNVVATPATLKDSLLALTIVRDSNGTSTELKVVPSITVRQLKGLVQKKKVFDIPAQKMRLALRAEDGTNIELDDDMRQVSFYSVETGSRLYLL